MTLTEDDIVLAGESTLGLLDKAQQALVAARIATDANFAAEVLRWETRLYPLLNKADEAPPSDRWNKIIAELNLVPDKRPANSQVRLWQGIAGAATAIAATLAVIFLSPSQSVQPVAAPTLIAALANSAGPAAMSATYDAAHGELLITPVAFNPGARFPELWLINAGGEAKSLGVIEASHASRVPISPALSKMLISGATLAVTLEPKGGAPYGKATGPMLVSGKIEAL